MARPEKDGLDYFPFDVDLFDDEKLIDLQTEYGPLGEIILLRVLCLIYRNGYYYEFRNMDTLCALLIRSVGSRWVRDKNTVAQVILLLAKSNLLDSELMHNGVLTSAGIQRRYLEATVRRQRHKPFKYWLLTEPEKNDSEIAGESIPEKRVNVYNNSVNVYNNSVNVGNNYTKESKVKESKFYNKSACASDGEKERKILESSRKRAAALLTEEE